MRETRGQWQTPTFHSERDPPHHRHPPLRPPRNNGCLQSASASLKLQIRNYLFASGTLPKRRSVPRPGSATPATVDPNPKQPRRRPSRHCSRVRWPRFPHLAPRPHPSRGGCETASAYPTPYQKDVRRDVRRRDRGQRPTATEDPNTKQLRGGQAAAVAGYAGPGFHTWPPGHIPQDNGSESASTNLLLGSFPGRMRRRRHRRCKRHIPDTH